MQFTIGDVFALAGVVAFPDDGGLIAALGEVAVEAVGGEVQRAVFIPFNGDVARREGGVLHAGIGRIQSRILPCSPQNVSGSVMDC
jgi:hypothetical protein